MLNELRQSMELLQNGLNEHIYLRKALMTLSKYFKYRGYDKDTNKKTLIEWASKQNEEYYGSKYYRYTWEDILKFINEINDNTYNHNYKFIDKIEVPITLGEMREINMLKNKGDKLVAFALLFLSKIYGDDNGVFYCTYEKLSNLILIKRKRLIHIINKLKDYGLFEILVSNKVKKTINVERGYKVYKEPNVYKSLMNENGNILKIIHDEKFIINDFYNIYKECVNNYGFKVSRDFKKNIKKYCGE